VLPVAASKKLQTREMKDDRKFFKIIYFYITMHHVILPYNSQKKTN